MRWLLYVIGVIGAVFLLIIGVGMMLPARHVASVRAHYNQPPQQIYDAIADVEQAPSWRSGLDSVRISSRSGQPLRWQEFASWGAITFEREVDEPPSRLVSRIADESEGFGGTWTFEIVPERTGSVVTITEHGNVDSPVFRFLSKYVFGHYRSLETYAHDLGRRFGVDVSPERVTR